MIGQPLASLLEGLWRAAPQPELAFLFPGQGSQRVGMGRELWQASPAARLVLEEADAVLGRPLSRLMFQGPEEELKHTANAQPAILACSLAYLAAALERGLVARRPAFVAGHSLGEYTALVAAGALDLASALRLVQRRGELMARAGEERPGAMVAIMGLSPEAVDDICRRTGAEPANYNAPQQTVVGGTPQAVEAAARLARERGGRATPLAVSGAFHTSLMASAAQGLAEALAQAPIRDARIPLVGNVHPRALVAAPEIRQELSAQLTSPVRWLEGLRWMAASGVRTFWEVGPGQVLTGLVRRALPGVEAVSLEGQLLAGVKT